MCTGMTDGQNAVPNLEIVDRVLIPKGTPPGDYVLGWRWDCGATSVLNSSLLSARVWGEFVRL